METELPSLASTDQGQYAFGPATDPATPSATLPIIPRPDVSDTIPFSVPGMSLASAEALALAQSTEEDINGELSSEFEFPPHGDRGGGGDDDADFGSRILGLSQFFEAVDEAVDRYSSMQSDVIKCTKGYTMITRARISHRYLVLQVESPLSGKTMWIRLDRRPTRSSTLKLLVAGGKAKANDAIWRAANESLVVFSSDKAENRQEFSAVVTLQDLRRILGVIIELAPYYEPLRATGFVSLIQHQLHEIGGGFVMGHLPHPNLGLDVRAHIQRALCELYHMPEQLTLSGLLTCLKADHAHDNRIADALALSVKCDKAPNVSKLRKLCSTLDRICEPARGIHQPGSGELLTPDMTCSVLYQGIALLRMATRSHTELRADLAKLLQTRAQSLKNANRIVDAPLAFDEAVALYRQLYADDPAQYGDELVESLREYRSFLQIDHEDEARVIGAELVSVARELYAKDLNALKHRTLIEHLDWYGYSLHRAGRAEEAEAAWNELITFNRGLRDGDPTSIIAIKCLIGSLCPYAVFLSRAGKADEARGACEEYLTLSSDL